MNKGLLLVISGPSGAGKSTVLNTLISKRSDLFFSVSATTRKPRAEEADGREYFFLSQDEFIAMEEEGKLLEVGTFAGNRYGTPKDAVLARLNRGENVILDIESFGAAQVSEKMPEAVLIFLAPKDEAEAERRLRTRATETEEQIAKRLNASRREYKNIDKYHYIAVNDTVENAVATLEAIILAEGAKTSRNPELFSEYRN